MALRAKFSVDAMLGAWILGLGVDLTTAGGPCAATILGPMPVAYVAAAWVVFHIREALYRDRPMTQGLVAFAFVLMSHTIWLAAQAMQPSGSWGAFASELPRMATIGLYTAVLAPLFTYLLGLCEPVVMPAASVRSR